MKSHRFGPAATILLCCIPTLAQTAPDHPSPASQPAQASFHVSPMIVKSVSPIEAFLYGQAETTLPQMQQTLAQTFAPLTQAAEAGSLRLSGPAIFIYHGASANPTQPFHLETGFAVTPSTQPFGDFKLRSLPAFRCASVYYTGPLTYMSRVYPDLYNQVLNAGHQPTDEIREVYLFWEGPQSPNNVIEIQLGVRQPEP